MSSRVPAAERSRAVPLLVLALLLLAALASPVRAAESEPFPSDTPDDLDLLGDIPEIRGLDISLDDALDAMDRIIEAGEFWVLDEFLEFRVLESLLLEIALIEHVDGFDRDAPAFLGQIHDEFAPWPSVSDAATTAFLFETDDRLAILKNDVNAQLGPAPLLAFALDELPIDLRDRLRAGDTGVVPSAPYVRALDEILSYGNAAALEALGAPDAAIVAFLPFALLDLTGPERLGGLRIDNAPVTPTPSIAPVADAPTPTSEPTPTPTAAPDPESATTTVEPAADFPWMFLAIGLGAIVVAVTAAWLLARRRRDRPDESPALGGALASADTLGNFEHLALVDGLTSLGNRRRLDGDLETTLREALDRDRPVAFAMVDVDHFKQFNDTHGHGAGDDALQTVARVIAETVRATDVVYRYGGEEFSVLLPDATREDAALVAERMCAAVAAARIPGEETQPGGSLTISVGVSTLEAGDPDELKVRADQALYAAKAQGRNRAVIG